MVGSESYYHGNWRPWLHPCRVKRSISFWGATSVHSTSAGFIQSGRKYPLPSFGVTDIWFQIPNICGTIQPAPASFKTAIAGCSMYVACSMYVVCGNGRLTGACHGVWATARALGHDRGIEEDPHTSNLRLWALFFFTLISPEILVGSMNCVVKLRKRKLWVF